MTQARTSDDNNDPSRQRRRSVRPGRALQRQGREGTRTKRRQTTPA